MRSLESGYKLNAVHLEYVRAIVTTPNPPPKPKQERERDCDVRRCQQTDALSICRGSAPLFRNCHLIMWLEFFQEKKAGGLEVNACSFCVIPLI